MSITTASWIIFAIVALSSLAGYYASIGKANLSSLVPLAILWVIKTIAIAAFGIYYDAWGLLAWAILDIFTIFGTYAHLNKETKNVN